MRIREPVNGATHLFGLLLAAAGTLVLLRLAHGPEQLTAFSIYGATLILLYGASGLYHSLTVSARSLRALRTLDHIAIYFLIAGTYTPIALITLNSRLGWALLAAVWLIAVAGIPFKLFYLDAPVSGSGDATGPRSFCGRHALAGGGRDCVYDRCRHLQLPPARSPPLAGPS
jgi:hemolysin III